MTEINPITVISNDIATPVGMTSRDRIVRLYGSLGLNNILDDVVGATEDAVIDQFIVDAEQTIAVRIGRFFTNTSLAQSEWIRSRATWIASYLISKRRGNEHYFESLYMQALNELDAMATGEIPPIADIPMRSDLTPSMSNLVVDDRFYSAKLRVKPFVSVGSANPERHESYFGDFYGWL